ncbi:MAG: hypothetical protein R2911_15860 [Caldilineaceae bacterium]
MTDLLRRGRCQSLLRCGRHRPGQRCRAAQAKAAGQEVITLDAGAGQEVIGIYPGALVAARTDAGCCTSMCAREIVVATGAAEIQPVAPGNHLPGIVTGRAAAHLAAAGIDLGRWYAARLLTELMLSWLRAK